jgi:regulator of sirC expression with transglutaminase-like and TPR domain
MVRRMVRRMVWPMVWPRIFSFLLQALESITGFSQMEHHTDSANTSDSNDSAGSEQGLRAALNRAVGGHLNLLREMSRVSAELDSEVQAEWMVKRLLFLSYEFESQLHGLGTLTDDEKLQQLNRFLFEKKGFVCQCDPRKLLASYEAFLLSRTLVTRTGAPIVLALIYAFLAERVGVSIDFVDLKPTGQIKYYLRWSKNEDMSLRSHFIDLSRGGATLTTDELIETLQHRFLDESDPSNVLETMSFESFLADYLLQLKAAFLPHASVEKLLFIQNILIAYQPSSLQLLGERALLHRRLGNFRSALTDLKRFFAFVEREKAPIELVKLLDELNRLLERHKSLIDLVD